MSDKINKQLTNLQKVLEDQEKEGYYKTLQSQKLHSWRRLSYNWKDSPLLAALTWLKRSSGSKDAPESWEKQQWSAGNTIGEGRLSRKQDIVATRKDCGVGASSLIKNCVKFQDDTNGRQLPPQGTNRYIATEQKVRLVADRDTELEIH